jgi:hypothetical protein
MRTLLSDFGNPAQGPLGEDSWDLALDTDGTILVVDPFAPPGYTISSIAQCFDAGGCGSLFRVDLAHGGTRTLVSAYADATQGGPEPLRPTGVAVTKGGVILVSPCGTPSGMGGICSVNRTTGARTVLSDFGDTIQGPTDIGPLRIAIYP